MYGCAGRQVSQSGKFISGWPWVGLVGEVLKGLRNYPSSENVPMLFSDGLIVSGTKRINCQSVGTPNGKTLAPAR